MHVSASRRILCEHHHESATEKRLCFLLVASNRIFLFLSAVHSGYFVSTGRFTRLVLLPSSGRTPASWAIALNKKA